MRKIIVYDLPTRFFHWFYAFLFLAAFIIAITIDDDNPLFSYHMMAGLMLGFLLVLRLIWGFTGTRFARFSSFKLNPSELIQYFKDVLVTKTKRYVGHNPASSYAAIIMFISTIGLVLTGIAMTSGSRNEFYKEIHELFAYLFLITVIIHLAGLIFHNLKHKDSLWSSMLDGKKQSLQDESGIGNAKTIAGILFVILSFVWMGYLNSGYNSNTRTLNFLGTELKLSEEENESKSESEAADNEEHEEYEHEDDND